MTAPNETITQADNIEATRLESDDLMAFVEETKKSLSGDTKQDALRQDAPKQDTPKQNETHLEKKKVTSTEKVESKETGDIAGDEDEELAGLSSFTKKKIKQETKPENQPSDTKSEESSKTGDADLDAILEKVQLNDKVQLATKQAFETVKKAAKLQQDKLQKELEETKKKVAELSNGVPSEEVETLKGELEELKKYREEAENKLALTDIKATQRYQNAVKKPLENIKVEVDNLAAKYSVADASALRAVVDPNTPYEDFARIIDEYGINEEDKDTLKDYRKEVKKVLSDRKSLEENAKASKERLELEQKRHMEEMGKQRMSLLSEAKSIYRDKLLQDLGEHFEKAEGTDRESQDWNALVDGFQKTVEGLDPANLDLEKQGAFTAMAAAFPVLAARVQILTQDNTILRNAIQKYKKTQPAAGPSGKSVTTNKAPVESDMDLPLEQWVLKTQQTIGR